MLFICATFAVSRRLAVAKSFVHSCILSGNNTNQKTLQLQMHCNLRLPEPRQSFTALITTPCQFEVAEPIHCRIIAFFLIWYVMLRCNLDLWPLHLELLQHFKCLAFKHCTKLWRNRIILDWVIGHLARFRHAILGGGSELQLSQGCVDTTSPNLATT